VSTPLNHSQHFLTQSSTSHTPAATPVAEGIYAITSTGRESHLAYQVTVPEIGEIQKELGIHEKGSFVVSVKNPNAPGPANATLDNPAKYPESIQKKFRNLRWSPLEPEMLDYENTQFLIIGEGFGQLGRAVEEQGKDKKDDEKETPEEEMEKLEEEVSVIHVFARVHSIVNAPRTMIVSSTSRRMILSLLIWV
jgi:hypothetical protein